MSDLAAKPGAASYADPLSASTAQQAASPQPALNTAFNLGADGDDLYAALAEAHTGLSDADSRRLDARLILMLVNHIGDAGIIREAVRLARAGLAAVEP